MKEFLLMVGDALSQEGVGSIWLLQASDSSMSLLQPRTPDSFLTAYPAEVGQLFACFIIEAIAHFRLAIVSGFCSVSR
jgi:hypothetical protein